MATTLRELVVKLLVLAGLARCRCPVCVPSPREAVMLSLVPAGDGLPAVLWLGTVKDGKGHQWASPLTRRGARWAYARSVN